MAISLTRAQLAEKAWIRANPTGDEESTSLYIPDVESMIDDAVDKVCEMVAESGEYQRIQTSFSVGLSGGQGTLPDSVMPNTILNARGGRVLHSSLIYPLTYLPNISDLKYPQAGGSELGFYNVQGGNSSGGIIYASSGTGAALTGTLTILACAYQTFASLAPELEDMLVEVLAGMAREKTSGRTMQG